jgi:hypothetical protein
MLSKTVCYKNALTHNEIQHILGDNVNTINKHRALLLESSKYHNKIRFQLQINEALREKIETAFGINIPIESLLPAQFVKGNTPIHYDVSTIEKDFSHTLLLYLLSENTTSDTSLTIGEFKHAIQPGHGYKFARNMLHGTTGCDNNIRLSLGPFNEFMSPVGIPLNFYNVTPNTGPITGGNVVTLNVEYFQSELLVSIQFGDVTTTDFTFVNSTTITVTAPAMSVSGPVDVIIHTIYAFFDLTVTNGYTYIQDTPRSYLPNIDTNYIEFSTPTLGVNYSNTMPVLPPYFTRYPMTMLFSDNSLVVYKPHSLAPGGVGTVKNSRSKSRKT